MRDSFLPLPDRSRALRPLPPGTASRALTALLLAGALSSCGTKDSDARRDTGSDAADDAGADSGGDATAGDTGELRDTIEDGDSGSPDSPDATTDCLGPTPMCAAGCGGDWFPETASCIDGQWVCPEGTVLPEDCPPGTCWGLPLPGETCGEGGWQCRPDLTGAYDTCPSFMCAVCEGLDSAAADPDCACSCNSAGEVYCARPGPACSEITASSLPGARIEFDRDRCTWTMEELARGVDIRYWLIIDEATPGVHPQPADAGGCGRPDETGLIVGERVSGDGQNWCICDEGLCMAYDGVTTLGVGNWERTFRWDGRNWEGPSDTGNEPGDPFPPGDYEVLIQASGEFEFEGSLQSFSVSGILPIQVLP